MKSERSKPERFDQPFGFFVRSCKKEVMALKAKCVRRLWLVILGLTLSACAVETETTPTFMLVPVSSDTPSVEETPSEPPVGDEFYQARQHMVDNTIETRGVEDPQVLRAMRTVPRHEFVLPEFIPQAYADHPLPIGYGQTISQPYIVAWMTELLELEPGERVLEIGTGSGYQAAVLAELGFAEVFSIEIVPELAERAANRLEALGYAVEVKLDDGYYGWPEYAPFDAIIVTAAPDHLPAPLVDQLAPDGRIVIPIGPPGGYQSMWKFVFEAGELKAYRLGGVSFVPFTGQGIRQGEKYPDPMP